MGRHAAPDDAEPAAAAGDASSDPTYAASHAAAEPAAEPVPASGARADLQLLRASRGVRWACLGAVFTAFALYTAVMVLVGHVASYAVWVWLPIVVSGVLVGAVLDVAHNRRRAG